MSMTPGFTPTHVVPNGGLQAWATPDPSQPAVATIEARVEVIVREERGAWAEVLCSNGWSAWVDGRRLVAVGAAAPASAPTAARSAPQFDAGTLKRLATPPVVGAAVLALGTLLPWLRGSGATGNGFDVALAFLFVYKRGGNGGLQVGPILLILALAGGYLASQPSLQRHRVWVGGVAAVLLVVFLIQVQRLMSAFSGDQNLIDVVGFGVVVALAGAVALAVAPLQWPKRS
jgi:hypothetical protein